MNSLEMIRSMLMEQIDEFAQSGKLTSVSDLEQVDKLTHALKSVEAVLAMKGQYSERGSYGGSYGYGYGYPTDGRSYGRRYDERDRREYDRR